MQHDLSTEDSKQSRPNHRVAYVIMIAVIVVAMAVALYSSSQQRVQNLSDGSGSLFDGVLPTGVEEEDLTMAEAEEPTVEMLQRLKLACVYAADGTEIALFGHIGDNATSATDIEPVRSSGHYRSDSTFSPLGDVELPNDGVYAGPNGQGRLVSRDGTVWLLCITKLPVGYPIIINQAYGVSSTVMLQNGDIVDTVQGTIIRLDLTSGKIKLVE